MTPAQKVRSSQGRFGSKVCSMSEQYLLIDEFCNIGKTSFSKHYVPALVSVQQHGLKTRCRSFQAFDGLL